MMSRRIRKELLLKMSEWEQFDERLIDISEELSRMYRMLEDLAEYDLSFMYDEALADAEQSDSAGYEPGMDVWVEGFGRRG